MKYPFVKQHDEKDCGAACLSMISCFYGLKMFLSEFRELIKVDNNGANVYGIVSGAEKIGFNADALNGTFDELSESVNNKEFSLPFIAHIITPENFEHFIVVYKITEKYIIVGDPGDGIKKYTVNEFKKMWTGNIVTFEPNQNFKKYDKTKGGLSKFIKLILKEPFILGVLFVLSLLISIVTGATSFVMQYITEWINSGADSSNNLSISLPALCICVIIMFMVTAILQVVNGKFVTMLSKKINTAIVQKFYNHILNLPLNFFQTRKTGDVLSRFDDASNICNILSNIVVTFYVDIILIIVYGAFMIHIDFKLFVISLIIVFIHSIVVTAFKKTIKNTETNIRVEDAKLTSGIKESVDGIETIKANMLEVFLQNKIFGIFENYMNHIAKGTMLSFWQGSIVGFVTSSGIISILFFGAHMCTLGKMEFGELLTFYMLLGNFLSPLSSIISLQPQIQSFMVSAERLNDVLEASTEDGCKEVEDVDIKGDIHIENLDFRYGNRELVLNNLSIDIKQGEKVAIVGKSGCGKTTLAKLLLGFYEAENGNIIFGTHSISNISKELLRKKIAYVSQETFLFSDTIINNLCCYSDFVNKDEIIDICHKCSLDELLSKLPQGLETVLQEGGRDLSGGQRQRIAIARALLKNPDILIMDEATSNLDTITEKEIQNTIDNLDDDITAIIIAHRMSTVMACDKIYVMEDGCIAECGTHDELINAGESYKNFVQVRNNFFKE